MVEFDHFKEADVAVMKAYQPPCMVIADMLSWIASIHSTLDSLKPPQVSSQVAPQVKALLGVLQGEMSRSEMTLPDKPNSRLQRYRLLSGGDQ